MFSFRQTKISAVSGDIFSYVNFYVFFRGDTLVQTLQFQVSDKNFTLPKTKYPL
jgi:hypothetical protein